MVHEIRITTTWNDKNQIKKNADKSNTRRSWRRGNKKGKKIEKGVDKRGAVWYNSKAHLRNGSAEAVQEWVMHLEN